MAKSIGNVGVTVSANTLGFQRGMRSASAGVKQFAATTRIAANIAGTFDSSVLRMGSDVATFSSTVKHAVPGISAAFAGLAGFVVGLTANFKELKESAISAAAAIADFFTKPPENFLSSPGRDFFGRVPERGPLLSGEVTKQISNERNEAAFARGDISREEFIRKKNLIDGAGAFGSEQLTRAQMENERAQDQKKRNEEEKAQRIAIFEEIAESEANTRRRNMIAAKEAQDEFIRWEHEKQKEAQETAEKIKEAVEAGESRKRDLMDGIKGADFAISSMSFRDGAPAGQVIGQQVEQQRTNTLLEEIKEIDRRTLEKIEKLNPGVTIN